MIMKNDDVTKINIDIIVFGISFPYNYLTSSFSCVHFVIYILSPEFVCVCVGGGSLI